VSCAVAPQLSWIQEALGGVESTRSQQIKDFEFARVSVKLQNVPPVVVYCEKPWRGALSAPIETAVFRRRSRLVLNAARLTKKLAVILPEFTPSTSEV
jgi:hypothetical protein